jgi:hypothetical protein
MKKSELRQIIREEMQKIVSEENSNSLKNLIDKKFRFHGKDYMIIAVDDDPKNPIIVTDKQGNLARMSEYDVEDLLPRSK